MALNVNTTRNRPGLVLYRQPVLQSKAEFIVRCASIRSATDTLRAAGPDKALAKLNDPAFPAGRASKILSVLLEGRVGFFYVKFLEDIRFEVMGNFIREEAPRFAEDLSGADMEAKAKAAMVLRRLAYHLPKEIRSKALQAAESLPEEIRFDRNLNCYLAADARELRLKLITMQALDLLDEMLANIPHNSIQNARLKLLLRNNLEFFPQGGDQETIHEKRVPRDYSKTGTACETMERVLRDPLISEEQIRGVQGTLYCRKRFNYQIESYRPAAVWRGSEAEGFSHLSIPPDQVSKRMAELIKWVNSERARDLHPFIRALTFYMQYDQIHPYLGRSKHVARFFADKILIQGKEGLRYPPLVEDSDFYGPLRIDVPSLSIDHTRSSHLDAYDLITQDKEVEFIFQMFSEYAQKLWHFYGSKNVAQSQNPSAKKLNDLLGSNLNRWWGLT